MKNKNSYPVKNPQVWKKVEKALLAITCLSIIPLIYLIGKVITELN